jgi:hypothetical protein
MPVNGELRLAVEDDEHLLVCVVKVMPHPAPGHNLAAMHEVEVRSESGARQQRFTRHITRAAMGPAAAILAGIGVSNALGQRVRRQQRYRENE